jgi:hypothetical protein
MGDSCSETQGPKGTASFFIRNQSRNAEDSFRRTCKEVGKLMTKLMEQTDDTADMKVCKHFRI